MPAVKNIDFSNGIRLTKQNGQEVHYTLAQMTAFGGTKEQLEEAANDILQEEFETVHNLGPMDSEDPAKQSPPTLTVNERIEQNKLIITSMYVAVHIFNFPITASSDYTIRCSNNPIGGDWWL